MKDYIVRMMDEQQELVNRIVKLSVFLANQNKAGQLPEYKRCLMHEQLNAMNEYFNRLHTRINMELQDEKRAIEKATGEMRDNSVTFINDGKIWDPINRVWNNENAEK